MRPLLLAVVTLACGPKLPSDAGYVPPETRSQLRRDLGRTLDASVDPCDDFHAHVCGWLDADAIDANHSKWMPNLAVSDRNADRVGDLLRRSRGTPAGDLYAGCMDEAVAAQSARATAEAELEALGPLDDPDRRLAVLARLSLDGIQPFVVWQVDNQSEPARLLLWPAAPDSEVLAEPELRRSWLGRVAAALEVGGLASAQAAQDAPRVLVVEDRLARSVVAAVGALGDDPRVEPFSELDAGGGRWRDYLAELGVAPERVAVAGPEVLRVIGALVTELSASDSSHRALRPSRGGAGVMDRRRTSRGSPTGGWSARFPGCPGWSGAHCSAAPPRRTGSTPGR